MTKILGIDYGLKKIGLALTDGYLAEPFKVIKVNKDIKEVTYKIVTICEKEKIEEIVIGLPESGLVERIKGFGSDLGKLTGLPINFQDENLTTQDAIVKMIEAGKRRKFRKEKEDQIAAAIILQDWLDKKNV
ncbi:MAG: Holliday junction resolvase RuvX [Candidatus Shapirobacteria bacterium]|nr:Holliday junction resolvase RuvX [Candidatus Shapirobacteria bacterium]